MNECRISDELRARLLAFFEERRATLDERVAVAREMGWNGPYIGIPYLSEELCVDTAYYDCVAERWSHIEVRVWDNAGTGQAELVRIDVE